MDADGASSSGGERDRDQGKGKGRESSVVVDSGRRRSSCGYCSSSSSSSISHGLWAYSLTANDYQDLLDRGWRRSGCYVYKPEMDKTCCPQYTIRLKASNFTPSKEQERVLKKMQRYLDGALDTKFDKSSDQSKSNLLCEELNKSSGSRILNNTNQTNPLSVTVPLQETENQDKFMSFLSEKIDTAVNTFFKERGLPLTGQNPKSVVKNVKPQMKRKLKDIITKEEDLIYTCNVSFQIAAYIKNMDSKIENLDSVSPSIIAEELVRVISSENISGFIIKACSGHLNFYSGAKEETVMVEKPAQTQQTGKKNYESTPQKRRRLVIRMKRSQFDPDEYALYEKYQTLVHQDKRVSKDSYIRFLVDTPIPFIEPDGSSRVPPCGFGSFHQQYLVDGRIIAVGVVDILPKCLSSKYLFWDPDYAFLSLGKFTALKEIQWVREMQAHCPSLEYYYLGYYIHSCNKMRYKAAYRPSELLCPLRFEWVPYDVAKPLLDRSKYAILSDFKTTENTNLLPTEKPGTSSTNDMHHHSEVHNENAGCENGEEETAEDENFMHDEDSDVEQDEEASSMDMDDDEDDEDDDQIGADLLADHAQSIGDVVLDVHNTRIKYKDLQKRFVIRKNFLSELEKQLYRYIEVVGKDLSSRIVYSLG
ncbi:Arginyl-tRNA--protein transferase [Rhynchospora pubera]|uniref:arginyltransferase n=1 Tax=Rhynchospora pubera TaxID=906938 RepID=A0AAV8GRQ9_9POAL|nr:Arginyl-tRNA--protein transferase [Rhynchospora pubera]